MRKDKVITKMKKIILLIAIAAVLSSCSSDKTPSVTATPVVSPNVIDENEYKIIDKTENRSYVNMNKYQDCNYDFDHDDVEETVTLYTNAQRDDKGDFLWDDSQDWILTVEGNNGNYILYDEHMHGKLEMFVSEKYKKDGNITPSVRLVISTSAGFEIKEYTYSDGNFREEIVYNAGDINELSVNQY